MNHLTNHRRAGTGSARRPAIAVLFLTAATILGGIASAGPSDQSDVLRGAPQRPMQSPVQASQHAHLPLVLQRSYPIEHEVRLDPIGQIGGTSNAVAVAGRYAYLGVGPRLAVVDVSDPAAPVQVGQSEAMGVYVQDVSVAGGYAYVLAWPHWLEDRLKSASVFVVDVSDPRRPVVTGQVEIKDRSFDLVATAGYVYVGGFSRGRHGLVVIDATDPARPSETAFLELGMAPYDLVVDGDKLLAAGPFADASGLGADVLQLVDVTTRVAPTAGGQVPLTDKTWHTNGISTAVHGDQAYVVAANNVALVDISDVVAPRLVSSDAFDAGFFLRYVATLDGHAYVLSDPDVLQVFALPAADDPPDTLPDRQVVAAVGLAPRFQMEYPARKAIAGASGHLFLANGSHGGMQIVRVVDPSAPAIVGTHRGVGPVQCIQMAGDTLYAADVDRLNVIDITDPGEPQLIRRDEEVAYVWLGCDMAIDGDHLYFASDDLYVFDISNPNAPEPIDWLDTYGTSISVTDGRAYVGGEGLTIVDVGTPGSSREIGYLASTRRGSYHDVQALGQTVYAASGPRGLRIIDATDPASPVEIGGIDSDGSAYRVIAQGQLAYLLVRRDEDDDREYVASFDVSDPTSPRELDRIYVPDAWHFTLQGDHLYLTGRRIGQIVLSVADPADLKEVGQHHAYGDWEQIKVDGEHGFVAGRAGGLHVLSLEGEE